MKKVQRQDAVVKEYVRRLSDDDLNMIIERSVQPVRGDRADISLVFQKDKEIDRWLLQSKGAFDWFDRVEMIEEASVAEMSRRQKPKEKKV
jgi:hypothetical protein